MNPLLVKYNELKAKRHLELIKLFQRDDIYLVGTSRRLFRSVYVIIVHLKEKGIIFPMEVTPTWDSYQEQDAKVKQSFKRDPSFFLSKRKKLKIFLFGTICSSCLMIQTKYSDKFLKRCDKAA